VVPFTLDKIEPPFASCNKCGAIFRDQTSCKTKTVGTTADIDIDAEDMDLVTNSDYTLCLFHPGSYEGYGHSCSSFQCCGSNTPSYQGTPGCMWGQHEARGSNLSYRHYERMEYPLEVQHTVADMEFWKMCAFFPLVLRRWRRASGISYDTQDVEKLGIYFF